MTEKDWTARDLEALIAARHQPTEWAFFRNVPNSTGGGRRRADGIAVNLWRSRGFAIHGFEIKVSRSDWQRELKHPEKADEIARYCDFWWVVAPDTGVVKPDELPTGWGLLVPSGKGLRLSVKSTSTLEPLAPDIGFLAALLRKSHSGSPAEDAFKAERELGFRDGFERGKERERLRSDSSEWAELRDAVEAFERLSGIDIRTYNGAKLGQQVQLIHAMEWFLQRARQLGSEMSRQAERIDEQVKSAEQEHRGLTRSVGDKV